MKLTPELRERLTEEFAKVDVCYNYEYSVWEQPDSEGVERLVNIVGEILAKEGRGETT